MLFSHMLYKLFLAL